MSEESTPKKSRKLKNGARRAGGSLKRFVKKPIAKKLFIIFLVIGCIYGIFYLGQQSGAKNQKAEDAKTIPTRLGSSRSPSSAQSRKTVIGTISAVDEKSFEVAPRQGDKVRIVFDKDTQVTGADGKKTDTKALKKDQKVIVTSKISSDKKTYTAQRIRIQKVKT